MSRCSPAAPQRGMSGGWTTTRRPTYLGPIFGVLISGYELERSELVGCASGGRQFLQGGARWGRFCRGFSEWSPILELRSARSPGNQPPAMTRLPVAPLFRTGNCRNRVAGWPPVLQSQGSASRQQQSCTKLAGGVLLPYAKSGLADGSSFDLFELLQGAEVGWVWFPRVNLRPRRPGNFTDIDIATRGDCKTVRCKELAEFGPRRRVTEAAD
jgi:hypothetical protein